MAKAKKKIITIRHPEYYNLTSEWNKFRLAYEGGQEFIDEYVKKLSKRESALEFSARKAASYCPAHAKTAVNEVKDAISERLIDVVRVDGPVSYQAAVRGVDGGVDRSGSTMNGFISSEVLPELLSMGKVGVYVDRSPLPDTVSKADVAALPPYVYTYRTEDILAWDYVNGVLNAVLLRDEIYTKDDSGLADGTTTRYRYLKKEANGVQIYIYDDAGLETGNQLLNIQTLPFCIFELKQSLMTDIANYQIALLNLGSSDLSYAIKSNFPFYVEQFDPKEFATNLLRAGTADTGTSEEGSTGKNNEMNAGVSQGRRYPKGVDQPDFIHPSPEPLQASMAKQVALQKEIRELVRLSLTDLSDGERSVESGLACIGTELERGERQIGIVWADYDKSNPPVIKYPKNYTLRTDAERRAEVLELTKMLPSLPSVGLQKAISVQIAQILVGHKVSEEQMQAIEDEINNAAVIITDPEVIRKDLEAGLVGTELASSLRGYPKGEVEQAKIDHTDRLARIAIAQSEASVDSLNAARGVKDMDSENNTASKEKEKSRDTTKDGTVTDKTRGNGKSNGKDTE